MLLNFTIDEAMRVVTCASLSSLRSITSTPLCSLQCSATHKPKPANEVVTVGTPKATLSSGVYPHGS